jgi:DnaJ-class molecular chaperone
MSIDYKKISEKYNVSIEDIIELEKNTLEFIYQEMRSSLVKNITNIHLREFGSFNVSEKKIQYIINNLVVNFRIHPDARWRRDGLNLHTEQRISVWDLILGTDLEIATITGAKIVMRVPPNTQPGTTMRVRAHGMPNNQGHVGDCFVRLQAELPEKIAPEIVAAIQQHRS